jgi:hypothetical protein
MAYLITLRSQIYDFKPVYPAYDMWRGYIEGKIMSTVNIVLLQISDYSYTYMNIYDLINLGYSKEFLDFIIDNETENLFRPYASPLHFAIYANNEPNLNLKLIKEDTYIEKLGLSLKRGDLVDKRVLDNNLNAESEKDYIFLDLRPTYHFVVQVVDDPMYLINPKSLTYEYLSILAQYYTLDRINKIDLLQDSSIMKTVMHFSIVASVKQPPTELIRNVIKDINS